MKQRVVPNSTDNCKARSACQRRDNNCTVLYVSAVPHNLGPGKIKAKKKNVYFLLFSTTEKYDRRQIKRKPPASALHQSSLGGQWFLLTAIKRPSNPTTRDLCLSAAIQNGPHATGNPPRLLRSFSSHFQCEWRV